jgi:plasmid stabilization system protein ParE
MAFTVEFSFRARGDIEEIADYIAADAPKYSARWRQRLLAKLWLLTSMPTACGLAPEDEVSGREIRQLLFGTYRVLFTIEGSRVLVLPVRHGARRFLTQDETDEIG